MLHELELGSRECDAGEMPRLNSHGRPAGASVRDFRCTVYLTLSPHQDLHGRLRSTTRARSPGSKWNAFNPDDPSRDANKEPISTTISRWGRLFGLSGDDAIDRIMDHRNDLTRHRVLDAHWDRAHIEQEAMSIGIPFTPRKRR